MSKLSRREFLRASVLTSAVTVAAACVPAAAPTAVPAEPPTAPPEPTQPPEVVSKYQEAPMLAELVAKGELPPVEERLPENPLVCPVMEGIGKYGGTMRRGFTGPADRWGPDKILREGLADYSADVVLRANIAVSWEINEDASRWTIHLREGMRWSDGEPFTSGDLMWWYEHELCDERVPTTSPAYWTSGPEEARMGQSAPDDYTVVYEFQHPKPLFISQVAIEGRPWHPAHYLKQHHIDLTEDKAGLQARIKEAGFEGWEQYWATRWWWWDNEELPVLFPWVPLNTRNDELWIVKRNPYFWQVDSAGNQLPYIDEILHRQFSTPDVFNMWVIGGEIDFQGRHLTLANYVLYKENEEKGGYKVHTARDDSTTALEPNHTAKNLKVRGFVQNRNVRKALSYAIDRDEINDLIYDGMAIPRQYSPTSTSPQYYPKLTNAYLEYDPDRANEMLDAEGYTARDAEGYRLWEDGSGPVGFIVEVQMGKGFEDELEMIVKYLGDVGVKMTYSLEERSLYEERFAANAMEAVYYNPSRCVLPLLDARLFLEGDAAAQAWRLWHRFKGADPNGEEPPEGGWFRRVWQLWSEIEVEPDMSKHTEMFFRILDVLYEELVVIGIVGEMPAPLVVKNGLRNLPIDYHMPYTNPLSHEGFVPAQTYYWEEPEKHA